MIKKHKIELALSSESDIYQKIQKIASERGISFNAVLEVLVPNGLYRHLLGNACWAAPPIYKNGENFVEEKILLYENRAKTPDPYIIEVKLSTDSEYYGHNIYQRVEELASAYSTSFDTMLAVLINRDLDRHLKYQIKWVKPQDFKHITS